MSDILTEQQINEELQRLEEWGFLLPMLATAARTAAPHVIRMLTKQGVKKGAKELAKKGAKGAAKGAAKGTGKALKIAAKHPGKTAVAGYAVTHPEEVGELIDTGKSVYDTGKAFAKNTKEATEKVKGIADMLGKTLDNDVVKQIAKYVVKYGLPAAAVLAIIYGGKKLYDYMKSDGPGADVKVEMYQPTFKEFISESE